MKLHFSHFVAAVLILCSLSGCNLFRTPSPPLEISAVQLLADYEKDILKADEMYQKRTLIVDGVVAHYAQLRGVVGIYLKKGSSKMNLICLVELDSQPDVYSKLSRNQEIIVTGEGFREHNSDLISLLNCKVK